MCCIRTPIRTMVKKVWRCSEAYRSSSGRVNWQRRWWLLPVPGIECLAPILCLQSRILNWDRIQL